MIRLTLICLAVFFLTMIYAHPKDRTIAADVASWYGDECRGKSMANGQPFDPDALTCASWYYPLGTRLLVTANGRSVEVMVTDRGPAKHLLRERGLDLSRAAFAQLEDTKHGLVRVKISRIGL